MVTLSTEPSGQIFRSIKKKNISVIHLQGYLHTMFERTAFLPSSLNVVEAEMFHHGHELLH